jgi:competence CoiA-like predicted nuclease
MIWAIVNNERTQPSPKAYGECPACGKKVVSKCGEINVWHWAHEKGSNCDPWYEPESDWHYHWKMTFGKENAEVVIKKEDKWHIADILTDENVVIELQNSPIKKEIIRTREEFYGERMMWVVNGNSFSQNFHILDLEDDSLWWAHVNESGRRNGNENIFQWKNPRKSWRDIKRPLFIDFGEENLFWIKKGMGTNLGTGVLVSRQKFVEKYGGNFEYHRQYSLA